MVTHLRQVSSSAGPDTIPKRESTKQSLATNNYPTTCTHTHYHPNMLLLVDGFATRIREVKTEAQDTCKCRAGRQPAVHPTHPLSQPEAHRRQCFFTFPGGHSVIFPFGPLGGRRGWEPNPSPDVPPFQHRPLVFSYRTRGLPLF